MYFAWKKRDRERARGGNGRTTNSLIRCSTNLQLVTVKRGNCIEEVNSSACEKGVHSTELQSRNTGGGWIASGCCENVSLNSAWNETKFACSFCTHLNPAPISSSSTHIFLTASMRLLKILKKKFSNIGHNRQLFVTHCMRSSWKKSTKLRWKNCFS